MRSEEKFTSDVDKINLLDWGKEETLWPPERSPIDLILF